MAGREKRKRRRGLRERTRQGPGVRAGGAAHESAGEDSRPVTEAAKSKDDLAREQLVPLREGERPRAVTVAAILAALLGLSNVIGFAAGLEVGDSSPSAVQVAPPAVLMLVAAVGMWYARYWAVLGFQVVLVFLILIMSAVALRAESVSKVALAVVIIAAAGTLFWLLVRSLARIQMPERRPPRS